MSPYTTPRAPSIKAARPHRFGIAPALLAGLWAPGRATWSTRTTFESKWAFTPVPPDRLVYALTWPGTTRSRDVPSHLHPCRRPPSTCRSPSVQTRCWQKRPAKSPRKAPKGRATRPAQPSAIATDMATVGDRLPIIRELAHGGNPPSPLDAKTGSPGTGRNWSITPSRLASSISFDPLPPLARRRAPTRRGPGCEPRRAHYR